MFALIRYVVRDKEDHTLKTVMKIFNFTKPFYSDEVGLADQSSSHQKNMSGRLSVKEKRRFSFATPRNSVSSQNKSKVDFEE